MLTAVLPSQTSRDAADTVRFLLECIVRNLNGVNMCGVASLCSRVARVEGGMVVGSSLPLDLYCECDPVRVEVDATGAGKGYNSFGAGVDVAPRGADAAATEASG